MALPFLHILCFLLWVFLIDISATIKITGAAGGVNLATGERPFRQEISTFATSGPAYHLFILALLQLQNTDQSDPLSYFQISAIHGSPMIPWDGVPGNGSYPGYCIHAAVAFPTWHRPYMALFEQVIWNNAQAIALNYPANIRDQYISAAITLRIPYWDSAAYPWLPDAVSQQTVSINAADGNTTVVNPLYAYNFQGTAERQGFPLDIPVSNLTETARYWNADLQQSDQTAANASLLAQGPSLFSLTYQLFTQVTDYSTFSCTWPGGRANSGNNIENIHNSIHDSVGGMGHMSWPEIAAFDPIFYLHHANVDRMFAMWQALNPNSYIVPTLNTYGSYYEITDQFVDSGNSSLAPFHSDNDATLYSSDDVRTTMLFGYTYPELIDWNISSADLAYNLRIKINMLYNPAAFNTTTSNVATGRPLDRAANAAQAFNHISFSDAKRLGSNNLDMQWNIDIRLQRYAHETPFIIDFFMGEPESDPALRSTAVNLIGSHCQFIANDISAMFPNGALKGLVQGHVSLSHTVAAGLNRGLIRDLSPKSVVPLLEKQLKWSARSIDGCDLDMGALDGLSITVTSRRVKPAKSGDVFPQYGLLHYWPTATRGKLGGKRTFDL